MKLSVLTLSLTLAVCLASPAALAASPVKAVKNAAPQTAASGIMDSFYQEVEPLQLLRGVSQWVDKKISFQGTFNAFSAYALDYKGAMRSGKDYISFLILRPDVTHHDIPLSELKLILPRKKVDSVLDLESGDSVLVKGKIFSAALGDPWVDVDEVVLLQKSPENLAKAKAKKAHELE